jgi:hypothetical protein
MVCAARSAAARLEAHSFAGVTSAPTRSTMSR